MKILLTLCAAVGLAVLATYLVVSSRQAANFERERQLLQNSWDAERAELEAVLRQARQRPGPARAAVVDPVASKSSSHEILERLKKTKVLAGGQRSHSVRHIIHQLESLTDLGADALPAIREFLAKFEDVEYSPESNEDDPEGMRSSENKDRTVPAGGAGRALPRLDTILPPSLRLGLVRAMMEMGGEPAEEVLAEMLTTSGRGIEVAYVASALEQMVPGKYRELAIAAAKDLLANPPAIDRPNRLDENAKNYLFGVLGMYNDHSFANVAQNLLVTQDGRVDRTALTYLTGTLKEEAVPALYEAFKDSRVTNVWERASLATQIFSYAGSNQQADEIFKQMVADESLPSWLRATAIQTVAGGRGQFFGGASPTDATQIQSRIELLNALPEMGDERLARARTEAIQKLSDQLAAGPDEAAPGRSFRTRLDGPQNQILPPPLPQ